MGSLIKLPNTFNLNENWKTSVCQSILLIIKLNEYIQSYIYILMYKYIFRSYIDI